DLRGFEWRYLFGQLRGEASATVVSNLAASRYLCASPHGHLLGSGREVRSIDSWAVVADLGSNCLVLAFAARDQSLLYDRGKTNGAFVRRDLATGYETNLLEHENVAAITISGSGRWLATGSDRGLRLWDATSWQLVGSVTNAPFDDLSAFNWFSAKGLA